MSTRVHRPTFSVIVTGLLLAAAPAQATEGCTAPYWRTHTDNWVEVGGAVSYDTDQLFRTVFELDPLTHPATHTMLDALQRGGGPGIGGARQILARAAAAAVLNAAHEDVDYPLDRFVDTAAGPGIIGAVQDVWDSGDRDAILDLAQLFSSYNHLACPFDAVEPPIDVFTLSADAASLAALPSGTCDALLAPWTYTEPTDVLDVWDLVLDDTDTALTDALAAHDDGVCPAHPDTWETAGDCTTVDGWIYVGTRERSSPSSSGHYTNTFATWGLAHQDGAETFQAVADGVWEAYTDTPDFPGDLVTYAREFHDYRVGIDHAGVYDTGTNATWIREGQLETSVTLGWPVSGEVYVSVDRSDRVPAGDLCVTYTLAEVPACPTEPVGTYRIAGAQDLVVTFDGDVACDGCGMLSADGVDVEPVCLAP